MQVFVRRSDLTLDSVPVIGTYDDSVRIDPAQHGGDMVVLSLPPNAVISPTAEISMPMLVTGWREANKQQIISAQATKLIDDVFPEYSQRNSTAELTGYIATYGADSNKWPDAARKRKAEIDRCWSYVNAVRNKSTAMMRASLPVDPTANSNWPTRIASYQPQ